MAAMDNGVHRCIPCGVPLWALFLFDTFYLTTEEGVVHEDQTELDVAG